MQLTAADFIIRDLKAIDPAELAKVRAFLLPVKQPPINPIKRKEQLRPEHSSPDAARLLIIKSNNIKTITSQNG